MQSFRNQKILLTAIALLAFLGFLDSTYLTILHYQNTLPPCTLKGCESVLTSSYSQIGSIPVSLLGSVFYTTMMIFSIILIQSGKLVKLRIFVLLALTGFLVSLGFFLIQLVILKAFCQYCLASEAISLFILTCSLILIRVKQ